MDIYGAWKNDMRAIFLDAHMEEEGVSKTHVIGHVYPLKPESKLDLNIETEHTNIQFLQYFMRSIVEDLHGRTSGKAHFYGKFKALNIEGNLMTDASLKIGILNTSFTVTDTIRLSFHICYAYIIEANATGGQTDGVCYGERSIQYSYF